MDEVFTQSHRQVFPFWDGSRMTAIDPLEVDCEFQRLMIGHDFNTLRKSVESEDPEVRIPAEEKYEEVVIAVFKLTSFDEATGDGMTSAQIRLLWGRYIQWREDLKQRYRAYSEFAATYGPPGYPLVLDTGADFSEVHQHALGQARYLMFLGQFLNRRRAQALVANAFYQASRALEADQIDDIMVDAAADIADQVPLIKFEHEAAARDRAEFRKMSQGRM